MSSKVTINRYITCAKYTKYTAVLDLKGVYDRVPRDKLIDGVKRRLPQKLQNLIAQTMQPLKVITKGDETETRS